MTKNNIWALAFCLVAFQGNAQDKNITLQECLDISRSNNPAVANAILDTRAARSQKKEAAMNWFPTVSLSSYGFNALDPMVKIGLDNILGSSDAANNLKYYAQTMAGMSGVNTEWNLLGKGYLAAVNIAQPVFVGGRIANGNALASLGIKVADVKSDIALRDNDDIVTGKYWTVVSLTEKGKALQQGLDLIASLERDVRSAVDAGLAKESDLMQLRLQAKDLEAKMKKLRSSEKLAKMDLFNYIGLEYSILGLDEMTFSDSFDGLQSPDCYRMDEAEVADGLDERKLLELSVEAKELEKKMALGESMPQVAVGASLGYGQVIGDARSNGMVYAMVKIPLSDWGKTARKVQRCSYELDKARNDRDYLEKQLYLKVNKEWIELESAWDQKLSAADAVALAELIETQKREEYGAGLCTLTELIKAQTDLQSARSAYVDSEVDYCNALAVWNKK